MQLVDKRTMQIIENFQFYQGNWFRIFPDNDIWKKSVLMLQRIFEVRLF